MIKKVLAAVVAAAALSVPLAGVASADPGNTQNGDGKGKGPGAFPTGAPGNLFSPFSQEPDSNLPQLTREGGLRSPGNLVRIYTPGCKNGLCAP